jgi:hypothetical protein
MALLANIRLAKVACRAKRLQVLNCCFSPFSPRDDMINVKINAGGNRRARTTGAKGKVISLTALARALAKVAF